MLGLLKVGFCWARGSPVCLLSSSSHFWQPSVRKLQTSAAVCLLAEVELSTVVGYA